MEKSINLRLSVRSAWGTEYFLNKFASQLQMVILSGLLLFSLNYIILEH